MKNKPLFWQRAAAVAFWLVLWQCASMLLAQPLLLVSPLSVLRRLAVIWLEAGFWQTLAFSFFRIVAGFLLAFVLGVLLAVLAGRLRAAEVLLRPLMATVKSVPVASFIIISLIWLTAARLSIFISFLMVLPIIYSNVLQGIKSTDARMLEMAQLYKVPWRRRLLYIYMPQVRPFLLSACSVALGISWKSGIAAEVIGIPNGSIGEMLYESKVYFKTADLFAWTVVIILASLLFEKLFLRLLRAVFARLEKI
ncbi:MAG: ABC transporter permease subunit [Clostridia bacterium]|nr:ABC transporter permease subunit [Clostridia bacterium]